MNDAGLRFDDSVPQQVIDVLVMNWKASKRMSTRSSITKKPRVWPNVHGYVVLVYRRPVVRHKSSQTVSKSQTPDNVLEGCYADVSLLGLMVDKAVYHLPLYRQHQRMQDSGIRLSRATLVNWMHKGIELLQPVYQAQWRHILQSKVLAMDEVPMKAGRKSKGKMRQTYFWPIYGEGDEIAFTWSRSRGHQHAVNQLTDFSGTLLTDAMHVCSHHHVVCGGFGSRD